MTSIDKKKYDLVIYGATGFTGQFVVEEVARVVSLEERKGCQVKWAVAGRNEEKLRLTLQSSAKYIGQNLDDIEVIEADTTDYNSISSMANLAKVVINCVGPYHIHGEPVVKACIENGANHVDISGEPQFLEGMQLKYDSAAEEARVHIVGACGFDSIPADVGLCHMIKNFSGQLNSVEYFLKTKGGKGSSIHTGTMESAALASINRSNILEIRKQLYTKKMPTPKFGKDKRGVVHKNPDINKWCLPLPTDEPVVYRTQRYLHDVYGARPVQFQGFISFNRWSQAVGLLLGALYFFALCAFGWTRTLLFKYPELMTAGTFSRKGPSREALEKLSFTSTLVGRGWKNKLAEESDEYSTPPDTNIVVKVCGKDPGYAATSLMMVAAAMTILKEKPKLERPGGVMTPGIAFMNTEIVDRLRERGMTFSVEKEL